MLPEVKQTMLKGSVNILLANQPRPLFGKIDNPFVAVDSPSKRTWSENMFLIFGPTELADCGVVTDDEEDQSPSIAFDALRLNCSRKLSICTSMELGVLAISKGFASL